MNITRFEPWALLDAMQRDFDRLGHRRLGTDNRGSNGEVVTDWVPAIDVIEEKDRFVMRADVPGVRAEDIDVSMENGILSVSGKRHEETTDDSDGIHRIERISGRFYRRFSLPDTANAEAISAKTRDGILEVVILKRPEVKARTIAVEAA